MNNGRKDKKAIRYLKVKDGNISVEYTNDLIQAMKEEYEYFFDTSDHLFDRYEDIRVFVKDMSFFDEEPSIECYRGDRLSSTFNGTVFFAKLGTYYDRFDAFSYKTYPCIKEVYDDGDIGQLVYIDHYDETGELTLREFVQ